MAIFRKRKRKTQTRIKALRARPRLRSVVSSNIVARYHHEKRKRDRRKSGWVVVLAVLFAFAAVAAVRAGLFTPILESGRSAALAFKHKVTPDIPQAAVKKIRPAPKTTAPAATPPSGLVDRMARLLGRAPKAPPEIPAALVRLDRVYPIDAAGRVLPVRRGAWYDLPVVTGLEHRVAGPGDTLRETRLALRAAILARDKTPALYARISEIAVTAPSAVACLFRDRALKAVLGPDSLLLQLENLWSFIDTQDTVGSGTLNLAYGRIAFLTQEE